MKTILVLVVSFLWGTTVVGQVFTDDVSNFLEAYQDGDTTFLAERLEKSYLKKGSAGVKIFTPYRIRDASYLARVIGRFPKHYATLQKTAEELPRYLPLIDSILQNWQRLYPEGKRPKVYIVVGAMNSGGTVGRQGVVIGLEMYGRRPETDSLELTTWHRQVLAPLERLPFVVAHEIIHTEQRLEEQEDLLTQSLREGGADFLGELICGGTINPHLHEWARNREAELWAEFQERMYGKDYSGWLYDGNKVTDRPADLGYWIGYQICKAYYDKQANKQQAIRDLLQLKDVRALLEQSGYSGQPLN